MSEMIERVARAIANAGSGGVDNWSLHPGAVQDSWRSEARAAIEAMREPVPDMYQSVGADGDGEWGAGADHCRGAPSPRATWESMIDSALSGRDK